MRDAIFLVGRALVIAFTLGFIGIAVNFASYEPISLVYVPPKEILISNVKLIMIDEKEAVRFLKDPEAVFVDCRECEDYQKSHIKGALCMAPDDFERRFPLLEPLLPLESKIVLYCYGPSCDMAEKVGVKLGQMGYTKLMVMNSGFPAWQQAKYPTEVPTDQGASYDDIFDGIIDSEASWVSVARLNHFTHHGQLCLLAAQGNPTCFGFDRTNSRL